MSNSRGHWRCNLFRKGNFRLIFCSKVKPEQERRQSNPDIATDEIIAYIIEKFRLQHREVKVIADGSGHYGYSAEEER